MLMLHNESAESNWLLYQSTRAISDYSLIELGLIWATAVFEVIWGV